eukprot:7181480-Pyramimonas_sp.AAC.1
MRIYPRFLRLIGPCRAPAGTRASAHAGLQRVELQILRAYKGIYRQTGDGTCAARCSSGLRSPSMIISIPCRTSKWLSTSTAPATLSTRSASTYDDGVQQERITAQSVSVG